MIISLLIYITIYISPDMDKNNKTPFLVFVIIYMNFVSGLDVPKPDNLVVKNLEGEVIVLWEHPVNAPPDSEYNVEMAKYNGDEWGEVASCTGIKQTYCNLSNLIRDYQAAYKVRVQLVAGGDMSMWAIKRKFLPNESELLPPSFSLWATSSTLTVYIHQKPILKKIFISGLTYTIYLEERGEYNKTTTAYLRDVGQKMSFSSLHWGREYCVSIKVESNAAQYASTVSSKQCQLLPEQEWFIMGVSSLSVLGVLAIITAIAVILLCYLRRPEKTPAALKSPLSGWRPLPVGEGTIEVVTDKGWFLSSYRTEVKNCVSDPVTHVTITEDDGEEDRRTSMDSGVGMESNSATNSGGSPPTRQDDSGCGSLGGPGSSTSCQTDYPLQDERTDTDISRKRGGSGVRLGCQLDSSSMNLNGQESGCLNGAGGNYRSQSHSAAQTQVYDEEAFKQMLPDSVLAEVVTGYRAGPQLCICSGAGQCTWCQQQQGHYETEIIKQYRALCIENGLLSSKCEFADSCKAGITFSSYSKKAVMDTVMVEDLDTTFIQLGETFPLLTALSPLPLVEEAQDFNMNNVSLSLCDVQLKLE